MTTDPIGGHRPFPEDDDVKERESKLVWIVVASSMIGLMLIVGLAYLGGGARADETCYAQCKAEKASCLAGGGTKSQCEALRQACLERCIKKG